MPSNATLSDLVRVLLVDDNEPMLERAAAVLTPACAVVGTARDGPSALKAAKSLDPDVIVLDISMQGMSGLEVACRLRMAGSKAAVVFLTVHHEEEIREAALLAGGIGFVLKPRLASDLITAVQEARAGRPFISPAP
jgi:DNA-binding NarL/FixJ family response regulator